MNKKNLKIYVCSHKFVNLNLSANRQLILAGAIDKNIKDFPGWLRDDVGDNISHKNSNYSELSVIYWIWKNAKEDYVGLEHYRRFLTPSLFHLFSFDPKSDEKIVEDIKKYDIIIPKRIPQLPNVNSFYKTYHYIEDFDRLAEIIKVRHPTFLASFAKMRTLKSSYLYNVWITKREIFNDYASWLFDILFTFEKDLNISNRTLYQQRVFGFLAERLFTTWMIHHQFKVKHYSLSILEFSFKRYVLDFVFKKVY
jgi:hypothetical protein